MFNLPPLCVELLKEIDRLENDFLGGENGPVPVLFVRQNLVDPRAIRILLRRGLLNCVKPREWVREMPLPKGIPVMPCSFDESAHLLLTDRGRAWLDEYQLQPATTTDETAAGNVPVWQRLQIKKQRGGDDLAMLDGKAYRLQGATADFLTALQEAAGDMVLGTSLETACGKRANEIYDLLPDDLKQIIDKPGKRKRGYRMI